MNRLEFMTELAALLQDISVEERKEAMQYYNDYFDDAGVENEQQIIEELGSPAKVAAEAKMGLWGQGDGAAEYRETGYTDTRFEQTKAPAQRGAEQNFYRTKYGQNEKPRTNNTLKVILIICLIVFGIPVLLPLAAVLAGAVLALLAAIFLTFFAIALASVAVLVAGIVLFCTGIPALVSQIAVGLLLMGSGMVIAVVGLILTIGAARLIGIVFPGICRGLLWICRRLFQRRAVA